MAQARRYAGLSQEQAARLVGVTRRTAHTWEHDGTSPSVHQLLRWAEATGFDVHWFLDELQAERVTARYSHPSTTSPSRRHLLTLGKVA